MPWKTPRIRNRIRLGIVPRKGLFGLGFSSWLSESGGEFAGCCSSGGKAARGITRLGGRSSRWSLQVAFHHLFTSPKSGNSTISHRKQRADSSIAPSLSDSRAKGRKSLNNSKPRPAAHTRLGQSSSVSYSFGDPPSSPCLQVDHRIKKQSSKHRLPPTFLCSPPATRSAASLCGS